MRRFSQRNPLVTLSDINITPLLDLAFVLLIIFVITTSVLEYGLHLELYEGGTPDDELKREDIQQVEVTAEGEYALNGLMSSLNEIEDTLVSTRKTNANMVVYIRSDQNGPLKDTYAIIALCQRNNIHRFSLRTAPGQSK